MSFGSNVAPKRRLQEPHKDTWACATCGRVNQPFVRICLTVGCREVRPNAGGQSGL